MIIVTGGAGFIGSCILARLQELGCKDLVVVDDLGTGDKWKNIAKSKTYPQYHFTPSCMAWQCFFGGKHERLYASEVKE